MAAKNKIPLFKVMMSPDVDAELLRVLHSGYVGQGEKVEQFEAQLRDVMQADYVLTTSSGTASLMLALRLAGVGPDDYVISTPMTCLATNMVICAMGAHIVWADVSPVTGNISPASVEALLNSMQIRPKAVMCVHWAGRPCDLESLRSICQSYHVRLIEDAAHAFGATIDGVAIAKLGDISCYSFQAIKHLTTVDGGAIVVQTKVEYERAKLLRWYGLDRTAGTVMRCKQDPVEFGYKFHMNDISATIGLANIGLVGNVIKKHKQNALALYRTIAGKGKKSGYITQPPFDDGSPYWMYTVLVDNPDAFIKAFERDDIEASQVHDRNDTKRPFLSYKRPLKGLDKFASRHVSIPVGWWLSVDDVDRICNSLNSYSGG